MEISKKISDLLLANEKYQAENAEGQKMLNKTLVSTHAREYNADLFALLQSDENVKNHFFVAVSGVLIFKLENFLTFINNRSFLPDSFTAFKQNIGLATDKDNYLTTNRDIVLNWAYKDCVLEGGQTKDDQKRSEVFFNEILAPDQINRLFDDKVFTNFKRYNKDGKHEVTELKKNDNMVIKGNNLVVLHSLKKRFAGKVKLIYIDPPYNTGNDSFGYNDRFNHSSWLTFMKNRLEVARDLLGNKGGIFVQIDHHQLGYLNVLLDEVFGKENKVQVISIKTASPAGFKTVNPGPIDVTEYILFYTKEKSLFDFRKSYVPVGYNSNYNLFLEKNADVSKWSFTPIKEKVLSDAGFANEAEAKKKYGALWSSIVKVMIEDFAYKNASNIVSIRDPHKPTEKVKLLMAQSKIENKVIEYQREDGSSMYLYKGGALAFYSNKMQEIDGKLEVTELLTDFWNHISWAGIANEGGVKLKNGKKPEKLLKQIIELATDTGDIVMDFFGGSGTMGAVAHKMNRQYILVEQLDYIHDLPEKRLINVINGDQTGISKSVNWQGGGEFVYCELANDAENFRNEVRNANATELPTLLERAKQSSFLSYRVNREQFNDFENLTEDEQRTLLLQLVDTNTLYVNYSDIESADYEISEADKKLNKQFYGK